jgi:hypothetical protein
VSLPGGVIGWGLEGDGTFGERKREKKRDMGSNMLGGIMTLSLFLPVRIAPTYST